MAADCAVRFLNRSHADEIDEGYQDKIIPRTGEYQKLVVQKALNAVPPIVCASVGRVVFVYDASKDAVAFTNTTEMINDGRPADLIYFNDFAMPESLLVPKKLLFDGVEEDGNTINRLAAIHDVIHEAIHVADHLLDSQRKEDDSWFGEDPLDAGLWSGEAVGLARQTVEKNLLKMGFRQEWARMHTAFVDAGMAREYYGKAGGADLKDVVKITDKKDKVGKPISAKDRFGREIIIKPAPIEFAAAGFMTQYGGSLLSEDIAEVAAGVLTRMYAESLAGSELERDSYYHNAIEDHACLGLQDLPGPSIPTNVAALYTKLGFLQTVGLITESGFRRCVGKLAIRGDGEGFHSYKVDDLANRYTENVRVGLGRSDPSGPVVFEMSAEGSVSTSGGPVPVTVELLFNVSPAPQVADAMVGIASYDHVELDDVSFPRGIYFLGDRHKSESRLRIRRKDNDGVMVDVSQAVALVGRGGGSLVEGTVVIQRIFNFSGGFLSAVAGDEPVGEPTIMTFRWRPKGSQCQPGMECPIP